MTESDRSRAHVFVSGRVQGVSYRASTRTTAAELGIDGWVRNLEDGRVEAVFEGDRTAVEAAIEWCHDGSRRARVDGVDARYEEPMDLEGFEIRR